MNIFWFITDSICSYERNDNFGILPIYKKLIKNNEGYFLNDTISLFPSTLFSILSIITGRFPIYIFPDFLENPPTNFKFRNYIDLFRSKGFNIYSFICFDIEASWLENIFNPVIPKEEYIKGKQLDGDVIFKKFLDYSKNIDFGGNNFIFIHFRAGDKTMDEAISKFINFLKKNKLWEDSFIIINSDHGYVNYRNIIERISLIHFDDISIYSLRPAAFFKLPKTFQIKKNRIVNERIYLFDILETVADYLNIKVDFYREARSFRKVLEKDKVNNDYNNRMVRIDAYLLFQPRQKTSIIYKNYKLDIINRKKYFYYKINKEKEIKIKKSKKDKEIFNKMKLFYDETEKKAKKEFKEIYRIIFKNSSLSKLKNKKIIFPQQYPPDMYNFLYKELKKNNKIVYKKSDLLLLIFNRPYGYGIYNFLKKYKKNYKSYMIINTSLKEVSLEQVSKNHFNFILKELKKHFILFLQRPKNTLLWMIYLPRLFNKEIKRYYKKIY